MKNKYDIITLTSKKYLRSGQRATLFCRKGGENLMEENSKIIEKLPKLLILL